MEAKNLNNQEKLDHMFEMVTELNEEMHHLKKKEAVEHAFRLFYMAIIVMALGGAYYFLMPFFDTLKKIPALVDTGMNAALQVKQNIPNPSKVEEVIGSVKNGAVGNDTLQQAEALLKEAKALQNKATSQ